MKRRGLPAEGPLSPPLQPLSAPAQQSCCRLALHHQSVPQEVVCRPPGTEEGALRTVTYKWLWGLAVTFRELEQPLGPLKVTWKDRCSAPLPSGSSKHVTEAQLLVDLDLGKAPNPGRCFKQQ